MKNFGVSFDWLGFQFWFVFFVGFFVVGFFFLFFNISTLLQYTCSDT